MLRGCRMQAAGASGSPQPGINGLSRMPRLTATRSRRRCAAIARGSVDPPRAVATPGTKLADDLHLRNWAIDSWRQYEALQQPAYPDAEDYRRAVEEIRRMPPLVFAGECRTLQAKLAEAAAGEAFVLQGGDCAEAFADLSANRIRDTYRVLLQMSVVLTFGGGMPVVKMGRMAGQFAKPRSAPTETIDGVQLPSYRGDIINGAKFDAKSRVPDPWRLLKAYNHCASTLNLLRGFSSGGYAALNRVTEWSLDFMRATDNGHAYIDLAERVKEAITFMVACGLDLNTPLMKETDFFTCHEALLLEYEEALTREDSTTSLAYDTSAHFLWCGERTRNLDGAHVEFLRGVSNPIGVKVSDKAQPSELVSLIATLNPLNTPGRIAIVTRMGADKLKKHLPAFISAVQNSGQVTTWICDPMHGNTESVNGFKTRRFENIQKEVETFFDVHETMGSIPGGIHLEMTGDNVTECVGGGAQISEDDLDSRYHTHCDPRLNAEQALELAFYAASRLRSRKNKRQSASNASSNGAVPLPCL